MTSDIPVPEAFPAPTSLFSKLAAIMGEIGTIEARGKNAFGGAYVNEADILSAVREKLADRNIIVIPGTPGAITDRPAKIGAKDTIVTTVRMTYTFCDGDTGDTFVADWAASGEDQLDKALSKAYTQSLRYFLMKTFLITHDAEGTTKPPPSGTPRADGQAPINEEQYKGIVDAFQAAAISETELHEILDQHNIPREIEGEMLLLDKRVIRLSSLDAIQVQKALVKIKAPAAAR